jgi:hypothetical protein
LARLCKSLRSRNRKYKEQSELVAKLKDRLQEMEEIGASVQEEVSMLREKLLEASEINQVGEVLQQENEDLKKEVARLREHAPSMAPSVLMGSSSSRARPNADVSCPPLPRAISSPDVPRPPLPRASRGTRGRGRGGERSLDSDMEELREDVQRAYGIASGLQRDVTRLRHLFIRGPRQVWADGYDQGWLDAPTRLSEFEELSFIRGWLNALRELQVPRNSVLWYRHELSSSILLPNPFRKDDQWIPIDAIPRQLLELDAGEVAEELELAPVPDDGRRAKVADYLTRRLPPP